MKSINLIQQSPEWHAFRANGVGASDIPSIAMVRGAFKNKNEILQEKLGFAKEISGYQSDLFAKGNAWEIEVRDKINAQTEYAFTPAVIVAGHNDRFFASLDGIDVSKELILEIKHVNAKMTFDSYCEKAPAHYFAQVQWQMMCAGYATALLAFVYEGDVKVQAINADKAYQAFLEDLAIKFLIELDSIKAGTAVSPIQQLPPAKAANILNMITIQKRIKEELKKVDDTIDAMAEQLLTEFKATRLENEFVTIAWQERVGNVNYKSIPELKTVDLEQYRGKGTRYITTKLKKEGTNE